MPGPGGGAHGGGGFRGGGGGGFRSSGSFHGGHRGGFYHTGWHYRPRRSGCSGGCLGALFAPFIMILMAVFMLIWSFAPADHQAGNVNYDSGVLQDYADRQYQSYFGNSGNYEDHLLLLFLTYEDEYSYDYIAWVGDHIAADINLMMGDNNTALGQAMSSYINDTSYRYSLDSNLAFVIDEMAEQIASLDLGSSFICQEAHYTNSAYFNNLTDLPMTEDTVYDALTRFTEQTEISVALVVDEAKDVYGESTAGDNIIMTVLGAALLIFAVVFIIKAIRHSKKTRPDEYDSGRKNYDDF